MRRLCLALALAACAVVMPSAQNPVFHTGVDYVSVDVVVTDRDDRPITDLKKEDFEIVEKGKPQTISDFQFVSVPLANRVIDAKQPQAPEPDVETNVLGEKNSRLFVIIIDDHHILESELVTTKKVIMDFLRALSPTDEVAVVFVGHSNLSQNFTTNMGLLLKAVDHVKDSLGFGIDALSRDATSAIGSFTTNYARNAAQTLKNVALSLAGSGHARRAIVYVSNGSPLDTLASIGSREYTDAQIVLDDLKAAFDTAKRADVPIYTLDPRGGVMAEDAVRGGSSVIHNETIRAEITRRIHIQQDLLSSVAVSTGGRYFINSSNLTKAVNDIVAENGSFYLLGFSPDPFVRDGNFHDFQVNVKRPGVRVRARQGYIAPAPGPATASAKDTLDTAMGVGVNVSGLSLRAFAAPIAATDKGMTTLVTVEVTYPTPPSADRKIDDNLDVTVVGLDPDAKEKAKSGRSMHFAGTAPPNQESVTFLIDESVELPSQPLTLRVGVASQMLGKAGTVQLALDVPKPADSKLQLSGIVVGYAGPPRQASMLTQEFKDTVPFQPTTTRVFAAADTLRLYGRAFWGSKDTTADVTLTVKGGNTPPQTVKLTSTTFAGDHHQGVLDAQVPLKGLAPGQYTLEIAARVATGQPATKTVAFEVK